MGIREELDKYGLTEQLYEALLDDCVSKINRTNTDIDWSDIVEKYNLNIHYDSLRKSCQLPTGGVFVKQYFEEKKNVIGSDEYLKKLENEKMEIRKERIKLQTANMERSRLDRNEARHEMYYEQIGSACVTLPLPDFNPLFTVDEGDNVEYLVALADLHYGAVFKSENNEYSPEIFVERLEYLLDRLYNFVIKNKVNKIHIACLGDVLQGCIRMSDLKINDSSIVKATVDISRLIAQFLNQLSTFVKVEYYHVTGANHTQLRPLGSKASEISDEDLEYVIGHYIKDLCIANDRIHVNLPEEGKQYIKFDINGYHIVAMHGHQIKNIETSLRDLSIMLGENIDTLLLGHYHGSKEVTGNEGVLNDAEILVCPSFVGSDPYSDTLMRGSKAAVKIFGYDDVYGHTETYKIVLN